MSYLEDDYDLPQNGVKLHSRGGGYYVYRDYNSTTLTYPANEQTEAVLKRINANSYERIFKSGGKHVYGLADGTTGTSRKIFLTQIIDKKGNALTLTYDALFRLTAITDAAGLVSTLSYELSADPLKVTKMTDPFGRFAKFEYDTSLNLVKIIDAIGLESSFSYSGSFINSMTTPYGVTKFTYTENGVIQRALEVTDPLGGTERIEYRLIGPNISQTDPENMVPRAPDFQPRNDNLNVRNIYYWDKEKYAHGKGDYSKATIYHTAHSHDFVYFSRNLESKKRPLENRIWYKYNDGAYSFETTNSRQITQIGQVIEGPDGTLQNRFTRKTFNEIGKLTSKIDPLGRETVFEYYPNQTDLQRVKQKNSAGGYDIISEYGPYNADHLPAWAKDSAGQVTNFTYNSNGQVLTITDALNRVLTYNYNTAFQLTSINFQGRITNFGYDSYNRISSVTDTDGYVVTMNYDNLNRPTKIAFPDATTEELIYDRLSLQWSKDRLGRWSKNYHNALGQTVMTQDPMGRLTQFVMCPCGALKGIIDPNGNKTTFERDLQKRLSAKVHADGTRETYTYDSAGRHSTFTDALGQTTRIRYNLDHSVSQKLYENALKPTPNVSYAYDLFYPRSLSMTDGIGTTQYAYHPIGVLGSNRLSSINGPWSNDTVTFQYDEIHRMKSKTINGVVQSMLFDSLGRAASLTNALGTFSLSYDGITNRVLQMTYPNTQKAKFTYDGNTGDRRMLSMQNLKSSNAILSKFDYQYNAIGNITKWTQQNSATDPVKDWNLSYDLVDQLISNVIKQGATTIKSYGFAYDPAGNRIQEEIDGISTFATHNNLNQLVGRNQVAGTKTFQGTVNKDSSVTVQGKSAPVDASRKFVGNAAVTQGTNNVKIVATDPQGRARTNTYQVVVAPSGTPTTLTYDLNGNMLNDGAGRTYEWDALNRLIKITQGTNIWEFAYNGMSQRVQEKLNGVVTKKWLWVGSNQPEQERDGADVVQKQFFSEGFMLGTTKYFYGKDHLGSIRTVTNNSQGVVASFDYDPYGRRTQLTGTLAVDFGYTGHYQHASGLTFTYYRAYDPSIGRWISRDPIGIAGGTNLYGYVGNNSINSLDSLGLEDVNPAKALHKLLFNEGDEDAKKLTEEQLKKAIEQFKKSVDKLQKEVPKNLKTIKRFKNRIKVITKVLVEVTEKCNTYMMLIEITIEQLIEEEEGDAPII